jgi:hypothetical protein
VSEQEPDPGAQPTPSEAEPESGAANTEVLARAEFATGPEKTEPPRARERRPRTRVILGIGAGYAILAAGTAFGVIAHGSPAPVDVTAVNASAYAAAAALAASGGPITPASSASHDTTHSAAAPTTAASPTTATTATPVPTVTGSVSDGIHSGDLRYFLLPPPQGPSSVQGDPDGTTETLGVVVQDFYGGSSTVSGYLRQDGFKTACARTYQDSTLGANVTIELIQFGDPDESSAWLSGFSYDASGARSISVPGESTAEGWSRSSNGGSALLGVYREGDTFFQVSVYGTSPLPASDLGELIAAQHSRLANG